jgi:hypothetical protein
MSERTHNSAYAGPGGRPRTRSNRGPVIQDLLSSLEWIRVRSRLSVAVDVAMDVVKRSLSRFLIVGSSHHA